MRSLLRLVPLRTRISTSPAGTGSKPIKWKKPPPRVTRRRLLDAYEMWTQRIPDELNTRSNWFYDSFGWRCWCKKWPQPKLRPFSGCHAELFVWRAYSAMFSSRRIKILVLFDILVVESDNVIKSGISTWVGSPVPMIFPKPGTVCQEFSAKVVL